MNPIFGNAISDINKIEKPESRLNIWLLIIAVIALSTVVVIFFSSDKTNTKELKFANFTLEQKNDSLIRIIQQKDKECQQTVEIANKKCDDCQALRYDEVQSRVNDYKSLLKISKQVNSKTKKLK